MTDKELLQQALDLLDDINQCSLPPTGIPLPAEIDHVMDAIKARLAHPEPTIDGWPLYSGLPEPESVKNMNVPTNNGKYLTGYAAPQKKEWVGLTDGEIDECDWGQSEKDFARAIEAKLKEKNT